MKNIFVFVTALFVSTALFAQHTGTALVVLDNSGRTSCGWVQLWENGPKWATFNVGATITDYAKVTTGANSTPFDEEFYPREEEQKYYNTANVGGLYAWKNPTLDGRKITWNNGLCTDICDVATALWGYKWKTPTYEQLDTLQDDYYTTWTWCDGSTTQYVKGCPLRGYKVSGVDDYAGYSIFLPAAGIYSYYDGKVCIPGRSGFYWSSIDNAYEAYIAYYLGFYTGNRGLSCGQCEFGRSIRAILAE